VTSAADEFLTVKGLAERWQTTEAVIYSLRHRSAAPPAFRIGKSLRFRLSDVTRWEDDRVAAGTPRSAA
jgi:predicted DNA-binding transcriptional regulator AlpA